MWQKRRFSSDEPQDKGADKKPRGPKPLLEEQSLYDYAVGALSRRMRTEAQLKTLLRKRAPEGAAGAALIAAVVARLKSHNYLSDERFAQAYTTLRKEGQRFGARRVKLDLLNKGVPAELAAREIETAFKDTDEETQARAFLARKRVKPPQSDRDKRRIFALLGRAGFSPGVAIRILRHFLPADDSLLDETS